MLTSNTLKINLVLFTLFLSLITVPVYAKTGSGKATEIAKIKSNWPLRFYWLAWNTSNNMRLKYVFILYSKPKNTIKTHETLGEAMSLCVGV